MIRKRVKKKFRTEKQRIGSRLKTGGIVAALLSAAIVFVVMIQMEKNILTQYEKGTIYVAAAEIPKGEVVTEDNYTRFFARQQLDSSCIPPTALSSPDQIKGLVAKTDIEQGVLLTAGMFEPLDQVLESMENPVIAGFKAEDLYQVVSGVLRSGDRVNIYSVKEDTVSLVWQDVFVQQVFDASGITIANSDRNTAAQRINVYLDREDVEQFYGELAAGSLRVVKNCEE
ncbi:MAG: SAF domain-containing protein [Blautia sp.]|nr:SAF domain-containing protein [Blautia sp.]